jgi:hypothetical protein
MKQTTARLHLEQLRSVDDQIGCFRDQTQVLRNKIDDLEGTQAALMAELREALINDVEFAELTKAIDALGRSSVRVPRSDRNARA